MLTDLPGWTLISYAREGEEGHKEFPGHIDSKELITHLGATIAKKIIAHLLMIGI